MKATVALVNALIGLMMPSFARGAPKKAVPTDDIGGKLILLMVDKCYDVPIDTLRSVDVKVHIRHGNTDGAKVLMQLFVKQKPDIGGTLGGLEDYKKGFFYIATTTELFEIPNQAKSLSFEGMDTAHVSTFHWKPGPQTPNGTPAEASLLNKKNSQFVQTLLKFLQPVLDDLANGGHKELTKSACPPVTDYASEFTIKIQD